MYDKIINYFILMWIVYNSAFYSIILFHFYAGFKNQSFIISLIMINNNVKMNFSNHFFLYGHLFVFDIIPESDTIAFEVKGIYSPNLRVYDLIDESRHFLKQSYIAHDINLLDLPQAKVSWNKNGKVFSSL